MRADRILTLVLLLQTRGRMTAGALATELEVSVRTVYRDIDALNAAGVPVVTESGPGGGCRLFDGYRFPLRGLSPDEAAALLALGVPAAFAELGLADALAAARRKITLAADPAAGTAGTAGVVGGAGVDPVLVHLDLPRWFHAAEPAPHLRTIAEALRGRRQLRIRYHRDIPENRGREGQRDRQDNRGKRDKRDQQNQRDRTVSPLGLVNKAGTWYLVAARPGTQGDPAVFRVGRVDQACVLPVPADRPPGFDLVAFWERWSAVFMATRPTLEVRVRASPRALRALPSVFGDVARQLIATAAPGGRQGYRELTLTFEHEAAAATRLAGFGGDIEVLSPASVRTRLIDTARQILTRYDHVG